MLAPITLEIVVLCLGLLLLLAESFTSSTNKTGLAKAGIGVLFITLVATFFVQSTPADPIAAGSYWNFYSADPTALFFKRIAILTTIAILIIAADQHSSITKFIPASNPGAGLGEFFSLPLFACAGLMFMASAKDLIVAFVALELVTISFYILVAFTRGNPTSLEAGVKYLILGALSTGFLVYGITWIFGITGETNFTQIAAKLAQIKGSDTAILFAFLLMLVGLGFKVGAVPFHSWIPDVYQGAPTPITAFLSVGSKSAGVFLFIKVLQPFLLVPSIHGKILCILTLIAAATLLFGNLVATTQDNLKRLLAYSSIGHAGYLLVAIASMRATPSFFGPVQSTIDFYLFGYLLMTLLSFLVLSIVCAHSRTEEIQAFNGLSKRSPFLAFSLLVAMASLAGVPFTVGFYGKFLVFVQAIQAKQYFLVGIGIITVVAGFYYYFKVVAAMWWNEPASTTPITVPITSKIAIVVLVIGIFAFGIPQSKPLLSLTSEVPSSEKAAPAFRAHQLNPAQPTAATEL